jgi:hypothetical protein
VPISARMASAMRRLTPGMLSSSGKASFQDHGAAGFSPLEISVEARLRPIHPLPRAPAGRRALPFGGKPVGAAIIPLALEGLAEGRDLLGERCEW